MVYILNIRGDDTILLHDLKVSYKDKIQFKDIEKGKKISILSDSMMKTMFQNENRIKYSAKLISYFVEVDYEVLLKNIHLSKNELNKTKEIDSNRRSDYVAKIDDDYINIEVNNNGDLYTFERNLEYAHRLYSTRSIRTNDDKDIYSQIIQIGLNNFSFVGNDEVVEVYYLRNEKNIVLSKKIIFIQIYIPNLIRKWYNKDKLEEVDRYLLALVLEDVNDAKELGGGMKIVEDYIDEAEFVLDDSLLESYDKEKELYKAAENAMKEIVDDLKEENAKLKEEKNNVILNMIKENIDLETISKICGISIEEIEKLK